MIDQAWDEYVNSRSDSWLKSPCSALNNRLPKDYLLGDSLKDELKAMLMKIPC